MNFTREMVEDIAKCMNDIEYFAEKHIKINNPVTGLEPLVVNEFQRQAIDDFKEKKIFAKVGSKLEGKTTIAAVILLHQAIFSEYRFSAIMSPTMILSNHILDLIFGMYQNLPEYIKYNIDITTRNKSKIEFSNMCAIHSVGSNIMALKGRNISNLYIDESEFISSLYEKLQSIVPCISSYNTRLFAFTSTRTTDFFGEYK